MTGVKCGANFILKGLKLLCIVPEKQAKSGEIKFEIHHNNHPVRLDVSGENSLSLKDNLITFKTIRHSKSLYKGRKQ